MAADPFLVYNSAKKYLSDGTIDVDTHTLKAALFLSTSNALTLTNSTLAQLTNQHANANGYVTGGLVLSGVAWVQTGADTTLSADDAVWTATGGNIVARFIVIYRSGTVNGVTDALIAVSLLNNAPADVTATNTNPLTVALPDIFTAT